MRAKTDQKSIKKRSPRWMASWHRFFLDFDRFWEASWEGNRSQDRPKKASKNDAKKKSNEIAKKVAIRISNPARHPGSWVLGRSPPLGLDKPRPLHTARADFRLYPLLTCLVQSCLVVCLFRAVLACPAKTAWIAQIRPFPNSKKLQNQNQCLKKLKN